MANVKVTALSSLAAGDSAATDVLPIVDVSADATKKLAISDLHRSVPDGTLSAPGIAFQSDLNSGLYRSGTDAIALVTNGAARILVDATGNVTIPNNLTVEGTTTFIDSQTLRIEDKNIELGVVSSPSNTTADGGGITLKGTTDKTIQWINSTGAWTFNQPISVTVGSGTAKQTLGSSAVSGGSYTNYHGASGTKTWFVGSNYNVAGALEFWQSTTNGGTTPGSSPAMMIDSLGNVAIGTSSPNNYNNYTTLTLNDTTGAEIDFESNGTLISDIFSNATSGLNITTRTAVPIRFGTNGTGNRLVITSTGNAEFAGAVEGGSIIKSTSDSGFVSKPVSSGAQFAFRATDTSDNPNATILSDGSATFSGSLNVGGIHNGNRTFSVQSTGLATINTDATGSTKAFTVKTGAGSSEVASIRADGRVLVGLSAPVADGYLEIQADNDRVNTLVLWGQDTTSEYLGLGISSDGPTVTAGGAGSTNSSLIFRTADGGTEGERMRITNTGLIGINETNPGHYLDMNIGTTNVGIKMTSTDAGAYMQFADNSTTGETYIGAIANNFKINVNSDEALRIDSDRRLLIGGTSTADNDHANIDANGTLTVRRASASNDAIIVREGSTLSWLVEADGRCQNFNVGNLAFVAYDTESTGVADTAYAAMGSISGEARITGGHSGTGDTPLVFRTAEGGTETEQMRIAGNGQILLNTTNSTAIHAARSIVFTLKQNGDIAINHSTDNGDGDVFARFGYNGTQIGSITQNGTTAVAYNTSSDHRLKENVVDITDGITRVKQLQPKRFNFIADPDATVDGFLAHEAQTVVPEAVTGAHNEVDNDGNAVMQGIDQSKLVPLLTAALQEAIAKIESLETRIAALES